ncbi:hypothetical protein LXA43DRAFT_891321 [Ganoderma leucocontextum]|nr:hypothetical protein LXA43DRAFT_891321 [Ganoderma leucocontextum]
MQALASSIAALLRLSPYYTPQSQSSRPAPPTPPTLNDDILLSVLSRSSRQTAASMMATCHFLYHEGAKIILRDWPVVFDSIASEHKALSLLRFIQAEHFSRCSYVRNLRVSMHPMPDAVAKSLVDLLPRMTSLDSLFLTIEHALESHPDLIPAFASLRSIHNLVINAGERSCELIRSLQSQLVSAQLYFCPDNTEAGQRLYLNPAFHPLIMLERSSLTLKMLTCGMWFDIDPRFLFSMPSVTYPNMHTFTFYESRSPGLGPYIKSFPNLAHLTEDIDIDHTSPGLWDSDMSRLAAIQRSINLDIPGTSPTGESLAWKQLCEYKGHLVDLWIHGFSCRISRLFLQDEPTARPPSALTDVLADALPTELTIVFRKCSLTDVLGANCLSALSTEGAAGLRRLTLRIELRAKDCDLDVGRALDGIGETISQLDLTSLDIEVRDVGLDQSEETSISDEADRESSLQPEAMAAAAAGVHGDAHTQTSGATTTAPNPDGTPHAPTSAPEWKPLSKGERTLEAFDVHAFTARFTCSSDTLQDAVVSIQSPRRCGGIMRSVRQLRIPAGIRLPVGQVVYASELVGGEVSDRLWAGIVE